MMMKEKEEEGGGECKKLPRTEVNLNLIRTLELLLLSIKRNARHDRVQSFGNNLMEISSTVNSECHLCEARRAVIFNPFLENCHYSRLLARSFVVATKGVVGVGM